MVLKKKSENAASKASSKTNAKADSALKPASKPVAKSGSKPASKPAAKAGSKSGSKPASKPAAKAGSKSGSKPTSKPAAKVGSKPSSKPESKASSTVQAKDTKSPKSSSKPATKKLVSKDKNAEKGAGKSSSEKPVGLVKASVAKEMMSELCKLYPDADCELTYKNSYELLTAVIMSAQTTDVQVNKVTPKLFSKFPTASSLASANPEEVKEIIKPTGYYNNKAKSIQSCAAAIVERFNGNVPQTLEELVTLPGVGRKTANVVLGVVHNIPGWTVDTHVQRLTQRLGMTKNTDPYKIELDLQKLFPEEDWTKYSITLIWHGRRMCFARNPECSKCPLKSICPSSLEP